jgi:hypothetical protein
VNRSKAQLLGCPNLWLLLERLTVRVSSHETDRNRQADLAKREFEALAAVVGSIEDGKPFLRISLDDEGDYIVRDLARPGCICHADTIEGAWALYLEVRRVYDAAIHGNQSEPRQ